jgi:DNA repair protein RadC
MKNINKPSTSIKNWAEDDQPYKKTIRLGIGSLSNVELIAILLRSGTRELTAMDVARILMNKAENNLPLLSKMSLQEMKTINGIGESKAILIAAAIELGRRRGAGLKINKTIIRSSKDIADYLKSYFQDLTYEIFAIVLLKRANAVIQYEVISKGGITGTVADPRIIMKKAIEHEATGMIVCHNHPSGNLQPSRADESITQRIAEASNLLDIKLLDHIIVSDEGYYSFADEGKL